MAEKQQLLSSYAEMNQEINRLLAHKVILEDSLADAQHEKSDNIGTLKAELAETDDILFDLMAEAYGIRQQLKEFTHVDALFATIDGRY